jgi:hypothetical protein
MDSAMDTAFDGAPHGDKVAHLDEFGHSLDAHDGTPSDTELDGEHFDHCCHAHPASITGTLLITALPMIGDNQVVGRSSPLHNFAQAPPTPPPNA